MLIPIRSISNVKSIYFSIATLSIRTHECASVENHTNPLDRPSTSFYILPYEDCCDVSM